MSKGDGKYNKEEQASSATLLRYPKRSTNVSTPAFRLYPCGFECRSPVTGLDPLQRLHTPSMEDRGFLSKRTAYLPPQTRFARRE